MEFILTIADRDLTVEQLHSLLAVVREGLGPQVPTTTFPASPEPSDEQLIQEAAAEAVKTATRRRRRTTAIEPAPVITEDFLPGDPEPQAEQMPDPEAEVAAIAKELAPEPEPVKTEPVVDYAALREQVAVLLLDVTRNRKGGLAGARALLAQNNVAKLSELPDSKLEDFMAGLGQIA